MSPKLNPPGEVSVSSLLSARFIVPSSHFNSAVRATRIAKTEIKIQIVLKDVSYCRLSAVSHQLSAIHSAHYSLFTTHYSLSSQFTMRRSEASACRASEYRGSTSSAS